MNARQKAKAYKRRLDEMMKRPIQVKVEQLKIDRIKFARRYPKVLVQEAPRDYLKSTLTKDIAFELARNLTAYVNYRVEDYPFDDEYRVIAEVGVVRIAEEKE